MPQKHWIAKDTHGNVVGKWIRRYKPDLPDHFNLERVSDVRNYKVDYWYDDTS